MSKKNKDEFLSIINDIINNDKFKELDNELHHGITRYGHSCRVAKASYKLSKTFHMDYQKITRAALLHDFYLDSDFNEEKPKERLSLHPSKALVNAKKYFDLDDIQANIIETHMFPLCDSMPKYKESWLVSAVDKGVALYEMYRFKFKLIVNIWAIFLFNIITLNK